MLKEKDIKAGVEVIYQSIDNLHIACPDDLGDWYFFGIILHQGEIKLLIKLLLTTLKDLIKEHTSL